MTRSGGSRRARPCALAVLIAILGGAAGCSLGPSQRPILATSGAAGGPATTTASSVPLGPGGPGRTADPIVWESCDGIDPIDDPTGLRFTVDCASVVVERPADEPFRQQVLQVARARAPEVPVDAPTLVVLVGEPGENGRERIASVAAGLSPDLRSRVAVIVPDLAGTGGSAPLDCLAFDDLVQLMTLGADPREPWAAERLAALSRTLTFACGDLAGPGLTGFSSTLAADDLDTLRAALGPPTLDLLARGFGATLVSIYADRYPGRVGHAVMDAPGDPLETTDTQAVGVAVASEAAIDAFAARCPTFAGGCPLGDDPRGAIEALVDELDGPPDSGPPGGESGAGTVLLTLLLRLGDPDGWPELATSLASAADGDLNGLQDELLTTLGVGAISAGWIGGSILYRCNDSALRISPEQLDTVANGAAEQAPLLGPYTVGLVGVCQSWPAPDHAVGAVTAAGAPPLLVLGAVDDPVAPYPAVQALAGQLGSSTLVSWQSGRHGSYPTSACVRELVDAYLAGAGVPAVDTLCPP